MLKSFPGATGQAIGTLQTGDVALDAGTEVPQLAIHPGALDHLTDLEPLLFMEGNVFGAKRLGRRQVLLAGIASP